MYKYIYKNIGAHNIELIVADVFTVKQTSFVNDMWEALLSTLLHVGVSLY